MVTPSNQQNKRDQMWKEDFETRLTSSKTEAPEYPYPKKTKRK